MFYLLDFDSKLLTALRYDKPLKMGEFMWLSSLETNNSSSANLHHTPAEPFTALPKWNIYNL